MLGYLQPRDSSSTICQARPKIRSPQDRFPERDVMATTDLRAVPQPPMTSRWLPVALIFIVADRAVFSGARYHRSADAGGDLGLVGVDGLPYRPDLHCGAR